MKISQALIYIGVLLVIANMAFEAGSKSTQHKQVEYRYLPRDLDMQMRDAQDVGGLVGGIFTEDSPFFRGRSADSSPPPVPATA
jgi:hypothetical protein